jgi:hypothetical protein
LKNSALKAGRFVDNALTNLKNTIPDRQMGLAMEGVGDVKVPPKNTYGLENKVRAYLSEKTGLNLGEGKAGNDGVELSTKGTGKDRVKSDIYKVTSKEIQQALEGYEQTGKFTAYFRGFEVKAQRSLSHLSDKQVKFLFKKGYSPKDSANDTIILHHHEQKVEGPN